MVVIDRRSSIYYAVHRQLIGTSSVQGDVRMKSTVFMKKKYNYVVLVVVIDRRSSIYLLYIDN